MQAFFLQHAFFYILAPLAAMLPNVYKYKKSPCFLKIFNIEIFRVLARPEQLRLFLTPPRILALKGQSKARAYIAVKKQGKLYTCPSMQQIGYGDPLRALFHLTRRADRLNGAVVDYPALVELQLVVEALWQLSLVVPHVYERFAKRAYGVENIVKKTCLRRIEPLARLVENHQLRIFYYHARKQSQALFAQRKL